MTKRKLRKPSLYKGLPVVDATEDLELEVSKSDISGAKRNSPHACAAARSLERMLKVETEVHISRTYIKRGKKWVRFLTPSSISREITTFDRGAAFEPGKYTLKAPSASQVLGAHRGRSSHGNTGKKKYAPRHITANIRESAK